MAISANVSMQTRREVYRRDGYRCALCDNDRYIQIHHVIPRGQGGPKDNPENMITLCSDCHALAHGINLRDVDMNDGMMEQAIVEYMADLYAEQGHVWNPWGKPKKPTPWRDSYPHGTPTDSTYPHFEREEGP